MASSKRCHVKQSSRSVLERYEDQYMPPLHPSSALDMILQYMYAYRM